MRNLGKLAVEFADAQKYLEKANKEIWKLKEICRNARDSNKVEEISESAYLEFDEILYRVIVPTYEALIKGFEQLTTDDVELLTLYIEDEIPGFFIKNKIDPNDITSKSVRGLQNMMNHDIDGHEWLGKHKIENNLGHCIAGSKIQYLRGIEVYFLMTGHDSRDGLYEMLDIIQQAR